MKASESILEIRTFGSLRISVEGNPVATDWPDELQKVLFCSLLSPLDLYVTWDRICRSMWGIPASRASRKLLEEVIIRPLDSFLTKELGFTPVTYGSEGISINRQGIHLDALEFYSTTLEGLRLASLADHPAAAEKFSEAKQLYVGSYLPGMPGKIIENTRHELDSLYRTAIMDDAQHIYSATNALVFRMPKTD